MSLFSNYVHISPLKKIYKDLYFVYHEPIADGYTIKDKLVDKTFFDNLSDKDFIQLKVGKNNDDILDKNIRSSKKYQKPDVRFKLAYSYECIPGILSTKNIKPLEHSLECKFNYGIELIKYESGDHFNEFHFDTFQKNEIGTILIFPPISMIGNFTGGDLIFKVNDNEFRVEPSKFNDEFTCVIFGNILHKCEPVLCGTRYVFKGTISSELPNILSDINKITVTDCDNWNDNYIKQQKIDNDKLIIEFKEKLSNLINKYYDLKKEIHLNKLSNNSSFDNDSSDNDSSDNKDRNLDTLNSEIISIKRKIKNLNNINIEITSIQSINYNLKENLYNVCPLPYYIDNYKDISQFSKQIIVYIRKLNLLGWNISCFYEIFDFTTEYEEKYQKLDLMDKYDEYGNYNLCYDKDNILNGKLIEYSSEYNDCSGNDIYETYKCTCLLIWKNN